MPCYFIAYYYYPVEPAAESMVTDAVWSWKARAAATDSP